MDFHQRLIETMHERGLKQAELYKMAELSSAQMNHLFKGRTKDPKLSTVVKIAQALGVSLDYLAGLEPPPPPPSYSDPRQERLNELFGQMSDDGRENAVGTVAALLSVEKARVAKQVHADMTEAV